MRQGICGIDPGINGGLAIIDQGELLFKSTFPITLPPKAKKGKTRGTEIDRDRLVELFRQIHPLIRHIVLEKVASMPKQGVASMFSFGKTYGNLQMLGPMFNIPMTLVTPRAWCKVMHEGYPIGMGPKDKSLDLVQKLHPGVDFRAKETHRILHDGIVDGVMLAHWGERKGL